jgi:hypothetical protein
VYVCVCVCARGSEKQHFGLPLLGCFALPGLDFRYLPLVSFSLPFLGLLSSYKIWPGFHHILAHYDFLDPWLQLVAFLENADNMNPKST